MANLEKNLNTQLIIRAKKKTILLTSAGEFWLAKSIKILNLVQSTQAEHDSIYVMGDGGRFLRHGRTGEARPFLPQQP